MRAEIISVGDEVLRGDVVNTNTAFLSARLGELGFTVRFQSVVGDVEEDLISAIGTAIGRSHLTVLTGGLGPTDDDLTKETAAKALGRDLIEDRETADEMRASFAARGWVFTENNMKQALNIEGAELLPNENGTAPGVYVSEGNQVIVLLPGPPRELEPLFYKEVRPRLERFTNSKNHYLSLNVFGIGESALEESIKDLLYGENPSAALYAKTGEVQIRITARAESEERAREMGEALAETLKERIGSFIYSDNGDDLNEAVVKMLQARGKKIALAESCTGGLMAAEITAVPGSSAVFEYGISSYADWVKLRDLDVDRSIIRRCSAVSAETAAEMAKGALYEGRADYGVGITGIAGPDAGGYGKKEVGLVYIAVADSHSVTVKEFHFGGSRGRDVVRIRAVKSAFDMVRRIMNRLSVEDAGRFRHKDVANLSGDVLPNRAARKKTAGAALVTLLFFASSAGTYYLGTQQPEPAGTRVTGMIKTAADEKLQGEKLPETLLEYYSVNPDTVGWISVPGAAFGNVVVRGEDNAFYRSHDFYKEESADGCIYLDSGIHPAEREYENLILYGSGAEDSLGILGSYADAGFLKNHPTVSFEAVSGALREYRIVSVYYANGNADYGEVQPFADYFDFASHRNFRDFVVDFKMRSMFLLTPDIQTGDRFITLVAERDDLWQGAKLVVVARAVRDEETPDTPEEIPANPGAVYPEAWYGIYEDEEPSDAALEAGRWLEWLAEEDSAAPEGAYEEEPVDEELEGIIGSPADTGEGTGTEGPRGGTPSAAPSAIPSAPSPAFPSASASSPAPSVSAPAEPGTPVPAPGEITVTSYSTGKQISGTPTDIISMIVEAEVGASFHPEAIKAQAVATITYLKYQYGYSSAPVMPLLAASQTVKDCVAEVVNTAMLYNGSYIYAPYCSSMAGRSNASGEVWVQSLPYLVSVESRHDNQAPGYNRTYTYSRDEMQQILERYYEIMLSGSPENWIQIMDYTTGGYVGNMSIDGQYNTTGSRFRANCMYIRSAAFTCEYNAASESFTIVTSGYGHGVGMSQYGANFYARNDGWNYQQILGHYYTGVSFGSAGW